MHDQIKSPACKSEARNFKNIPAPEYRHITLHYQLEVELDEELEEELEFITELVEELLFELEEAAFDFELEELTDDELTLEELDEETVPLEELDDKELEDTSPRISL